MPGRDGGAPRFDEQDRELLLEELDGFTASLPDEKCQDPLPRPAAGHRSRDRFPRKTSPASRTSSNSPSSPAACAVARARWPRKRLLRIFNGTPRGAAVKQAVAETNEALGALKGQVLDTVSFAPGTPGAYRLLIDTEACRVDLEITRQGVSVKNVEIGI